MKTLEEILDRKKHIEEALVQLDKTVKELTVEYLELQGVEKFLRSK